MKRALQTKLLRWFQRSARPMPWRETKDPYKIWVSEIMLQQTQVATVIPYYNKWVKKFPTVKKLAMSPLSEVLNAWAGLGYYRRARSLHAGAQYVVSKLSGQVPDTVEALMKLPGIGRYTAGAISSIAFDKPAPILDGNVIRILSRIFGIKKDIASTKTINQLWEISESLVPNKSAGDFNQAMMELGATVCLPDNPQCGKCPVKTLCEAKKLGAQLKLPFRSNKEKIIRKKTFALVLTDGKKVVLQKQPQEGRWGGLWMFPFAETKSTLLKSFKLSNQKIKKLTSVRHGFTKYSIDLTALKSSLTQEKLNLLSEEKGLKSFPIQSLKKRALPAPHKKIAKALVSNV